MSFTPIGDTLKQQGSTGANKSQVESGEAITAAEKAFTDLFGKELAAHAKPLYLKNRTMTVTCTSSALAQEIRLNQKEIVKKINSLLGKNDVDRIRYLS